MKDFISIIVPFLNSEKTLEKCIKSILNQTINNYEIILVDNDSIDLSKNIALYYSQKYNFIHYYNIHHKNVGLARNFGLKKSKGNIICFVDSDDIISNNYLKLMYENYKDNDLVICNFTSNKHKLENKIKYKKKINTQEAFEAILQDKKVRGYVWNKLFRKEILENKNINFNCNLIIGEDVDFVFEYLKYCNNTTFINGKLYYYNRRKDNTVNNINNYKYALKSYENLFNKYKNYNKNYKNMNFINYLYLKKYYELKYYKKNTIKSNKTYFSNNQKFLYNLKLFIYKTFIPLIILLKKVRDRN